MDSFDAEAELGVLILYSVASQKPLAEVVSLYGKPELRAKFSAADPRRPAKSNYIDDSLRPPKYAKINEIDDEDPMDLSEEQIPDLRMKPIILPKKQDRQKLYHLRNVTKVYEYEIDEALSPSEKINKLNFKEETKLTPFQKAYCSLTVALHLGKLYHVPVTIPMATPDWLTALTAAVLRSIESDHLSDNMPLIKLLITTLQTRAAESLHIRRLLTTAACRCARERLPKLWHTQN
jgi:hypothetical protein